MINKTKRSQKHEVTVLKAFLKATTKGASASLMQSGPEPTSMQVYFPTPLDKISSMMRAVLLLRTTSLTTKEVSLENLHRRDPGKSDRPPVSKE